MSYSYVFDPEKYALKPKKQLLEKFLCLKYNMIVWSDPELPYNQ